MDLISYKKCFYSHGYYFEKCQQGWNSKKFCSTSMWLHIFLMEIGKHENHLFGILDREQLKEDAREWPQPLTMQRRNRNEFI